MKSGTSPRTLAITVAVGSAFGLMPILGISTIICTFIALRFRWNMVVIQFVNYIVYPLQLILFIPFIKAGITVFGIEALQIPVAEIFKLFETNWLLALKDLSWTLLAATAIWLMLCLIYIPLIYFVLEAFFSKVIENKTVVTH